MFPSIIIAAIFAAAAPDVFGKKVVVMQPKLTNYTSVYARLSDLLIGAYLWPHPVRGGSGGRERGCAPAQSMRHAPWSGTPLMAVILRPNDREGDRRGGRVGGLNRYILLFDEA